LTGSGFLAALHLVTTEFMHRLRQQAKMSADRNAIATELTHGFGQPGAAFQLDDMRSAFLHQPGGVADALIDRGVAGKGHIGHQQRGPAAVRHQPGVIDHVFHRHRDGSLPTLNDHAQ
jgi:hypothetical protein